MKFAWGLVAVATLLLLGGMALGERVTTSTTTLTLQTAGVDGYCYTGAGAATWTLPPVAGNAGQTFTIVNRAGAAAITLQRAGGDNLWKDGATATSVTVNAGTTLELYNDGTYWSVVNYTYSSLTNATFNSLTLTTPLAVLQGGTGSTSAASARTALGVGTSDAPTFAGVTASGNFTTTAGADRKFTLDRTATTDYCRNLFHTGGTEMWAFGMRGDGGGSGVNNTLNLTGNAADSYPNILALVPNGSNYAAYWFGSTTTNAAHWENANGAAVFNEQGGAQNFRVESDTNANMLFVDGTNNRVGIGTGSPGVALQVAGAATIDGHLLWTTSNTYDIGASGAVNLPRTLYVGTNVQVISNTGGIGIGSSAPDAWLYRDGANQLAIRNSTSAQGLRVYNTDNGANDEFYQEQWTSNVLYVGPTLTGSGTQRTMALNAGAQKTLTESSATNFVQIAVASGTQVGGVIHYTLIANDATDYQTRAGTVAFAAVNKAGTETGAVGTADETVAVSVGTLTNTFTIDTSPTNAINIQANAVSSLTQTTLAIRYWVEITGPAVTVTPQ